MRSLCILTRDIPFAEFIRLTLDEHIPQISVCENADALPESDAYIVDLDTAEMPVTGKPVLLCGWGRERPEGAVLWAERPFRPARLRALLGYKQAAMQFDLVAARVIGREADSWSHMIVIDRGTADGVKENMAVVTEKGLVGHVIEAGPNYAKVQLILDPRSSVGTLVQRAESRVVGIVEGDPANPTMPRMINVPKNADIEEGDIIVTSGFGGMYPKGLVVGLVSSLENDEAGLLKIALLEPAVDFQKLEDVAVIVNSREAPPEPLKTPVQTPGTETDPAAEKKAQEAQAADGENTAQEQDMQAQAGESD